MSVELLVCNKQMLIHYNHRMQNFQSKLLHQEYQLTLGSYNMRMHYFQSKLLRQVYQLTLGHYNL